jgi:hypothetical protein
MATLSGAVNGFRPSSGAFHFRNSWPDVPLFTIELGTLKIPIGTAAGGLCGGMAFAVRDLWQAKVGKLPPDSVPPAAGDPLYEYLVKRLWESWDVPMGPLKYFSLMDPGTGSGLVQTLLKALSIVLPTGWAPQQGRASIMIGTEWPKVKEDLNRNRLSALGLVKILSDNPLDLGHNHQVLAYAYELTDDDLTLHLYDPNWPDNDDISLSLNIGLPDQPTPVHYHSPAVTEETVYCFFRSNYQYRQPWKKVISSITHS